MKSTGILRRIDDLGRLVLPMELRNKLELGKGDPIEIYVEGDTVVLKKYEPSCIFCNESENITKHKGKNICRNCVEELHSSR